MSETRASRHRGISFAPAPAWAGFEPFVRPATAPEELVDDGLIRWRYEEAYDLRGPQPRLSRRTVHEVVTPEGMASAATFDANFDPSYQTIALGAVRVIRNGQAREVLTDEALQVLRREGDLERAIYDGRLTVHLIIPDVRVGDLVETAYTLTGGRPIFAGRFSAMPSLQWSSPVDVRRFRVIAGQGRRLTGRHWGAPVRRTETPIEGGIAHEWLAEGLPAFHYEPATPSEWTGHAHLLVTDEMSWADVADRFRPGYALPPRLPPELEAVAAQIESEHADPAARTAAALKRVQAEVRYLAFSIGEGGFTPRAVEDIWATRFGDCKDVSRLLAALLSRLEIDATPALVNTYMGHDLWETPPSLIAFDHCIVRVRLGGRTFWLDPTYSVQGGDLEALVKASHGYALALEPQARLEPMLPPPLLTTLETTHRLKLGSTRATPADFTVTSTFRGWRADDLRRRLVASGLEAMRRDFQRYYESHYGRLRVLEAMTVTDDEAANALTTYERYEITEPWQEVDNGKAAQFTTMDEAIRPDLNIGYTADRTQPIYLGEPRRTIQRTIIELARPWRCQTWTDRFEVGGLTLSALCSQPKPRRVEVHAVLECRDRILPADKAEAFYSAKARADASAAITLTHALRNGEFSEVADAGPTWGRWVWGALVLAYLAAMIYRHFVPG